MRCCLCFLTAIYCAALLAAPSRAEQLIFSTYTSVGNMDLLDSFGSVTFDVGTQVTPFNMSPGTLDRIDVRFALSFTGVAIYGSEGGTVSLTGYGDTYIDGIQYPGGFGPNISESGANGMVGSNSLDHSDVTFINGVDDPGIFAAFLGNDPVPLVWSGSLEFSGTPGGTSMDASIGGSSHVIVDFYFTPVPEPAGLMIATIGLACLIAWSRRLPTIGSAGTNLLHLRNLPALASCDARDVHPS